MESTWSVPVAPGISDPMCCQLFTALRPMYGSWICQTRVADESTEPSERQTSERRVNTALGRRFADDITSVSTQLSSCTTCCRRDRYGTGVDRSLADRLTTGMPLAPAAWPKPVPQVQARRCVLYSSALYSGQTVADSDQCVYMFRVIAWSEVLPSP